MRPGIENVISLVIFRKESPPQKKRLHVMILMTRVVHEEFWDEVEHITSVGQS